MASDIFYVPANLLRTEKKASDKLKIPANFLRNENMESDIFYVPANYLRNETFYVMKKDLAGRSNYKS